MPGLSGLLSWLCDAIDCLLGGILRVAGHDLCQVEFLLAHYGREGARHPDQLFRAVAPVQGGPTVDFVLADPPHLAGGPPTAIGGGDLIVIELLRYVLVRRPVQPKVINSPNDRRCRRVQF